jgi:predicted metal-binding membrane protein
VLDRAFQVSPLKARCLEACRSPAGFTWRFYRRGPGASWRLGIRHGIFRLGCCWALMLVKFALGAGCLMWMAALTGLMLIVPWGKRSCRRRAACSSSGAC